MMTTGRDQQRTSGRAVVVARGAALAGLLAMAACGPKNVVPEGHDHPANPNAAAAPEGTASDTLSTEGDPDMDTPSTQGDHDMDSMDHGDKPPAPTVAALERTAFDKARPVFDKYCASCHTSKSTYKKKKKAVKHFSMDSYPFGGHHAQELGKTIRKVLGASGKDATMPLDDPGAVDGEELALVLAWADAFDKAHPADTKHGGHEH